MCAAPVEGIRALVQRHHCAGVRPGGAGASSRSGQRGPQFQPAGTRAAVPAVRAQAAVQHYRCADRQPASGIGRCAQSADAAVDRTEPATAPAGGDPRSPGLVCAFPRRPRGDSRVDATGTRRDEKPAQGNPGTYMAGPRIHARRSDPAVGRRRHATQLFSRLPVPAA